MRNRVICLFCLAGMMISLVGCETPFEQKGREVKFTATSKGGVLTKTAYDTETEGYAPIKWEENDVIRIYSPNEDFILNHDGEIHTHTGIEGDNYSYVYADYALDGFTTAGHLRKATLKNILLDDQGHTSSLYWKTTTGNATFYGVYPTNTGINWFNNGGLAFKVMIPSEQSITFSNGVHSPSISSLPLIAMQQSVNSGDAVDLNFYPAFTAFEFNLKSQEDELTLNSFTLKINDEEGDASSINGYLTGACIYAPALDKKDGDPFYIKNSKIYYFNETTKETDSDPCKKELTITFPEGTTISTTKQVTFTLFALPNDISKASITINLEVDGQEKPRTLKLQQQQKNANNELVVGTDGKPVYDWITFPAGHKARIKGLAVDGGSKWQLTIDDQVLPWIADEQTTSFKSNIGIVGQTFSGYVTTDPLFIYEDVDNNILRSTTPYYDGQVVSADGYYYLNNGQFTQNGYYLRLTTKIAGVDNPCITYRFTPTAPIGGYWQLSPEAVEGSLDYFRITVDDGINGESERLQGQVMGVPVTIFIRPTTAYLALDNAPVCSCIIKCNMSPSVSWDPLYSADSEFQGAHTDGTFSYYKFRIAK